MARIPHGADLIDNPISKAPGFRIGNVIVMAGVPVDHAGDARRRRADAEDRRRRCCRSRIDARGLPEGAYGTPLAAVQKAHPGRRRSAPTRPSTAQRFTNQIVVRARDAAQLEAARRRRRRHARRLSSPQRATPPRRRIACLKPRSAQPRSPHVAARSRKPFRSPGTSSTATRARWPGGWPRPGRSRRSSASRAAGWCRPRSCRASSARASSRRCASRATTTTRRRASCRC